MSRRNSKRPLAAAVGGLVFAASLLVHGQTLPSNPPAKADADVVDAAKEGIAQTVYVQLEVEDILRRIEDRRKSNREQFQSLTSDGALSAESNLAAETRNEYLAIKRELFPGGGRGRVVVREDFPNLPALAIDLPDYAALQELAAQPRVKSINRISAPVAVLMVEGAAAS